MLAVAAQKAHQVMVSELYSEQDLAEGEQLFEQPWQFVKGVVDLDSLPDEQWPEVAFAGRSNVGKSSLINAVVRQNGLARTSNTPGRTQELNYFAPQSGGFHLVDLPGYGFAKAPKDKVARWTEFIKAYLAGRPHLARAFVLIDSRHGIKAVDRTIMTLLSETAVAYQVVMTKADKISVKALEAQRADVEAEVSKAPAAYPVVITTSSEKKTGIRELRATLAQIRRNFS